MCNVTPSDLQHLVTPEVITRYCDYLLNELQRTSSYVRTCLILLPGIFRHPRYEGIEADWLRKLISELPIDPESLIQERKERKWLPLEILKEIPARMRAARAAKPNLSPTDLACKVSDELMMAWLPMLPWRQFNLRMCRLARKEDGGNLFKDRLPDSATMSVPEWVRRALEADPRVTFWQFYFREDENKTDRIIRALVPRSLVPLLESYVNDHRPQLLRGHDTNFLFITDKGHGFTQQQVTNLVKKLTFKYAGRQVTPHLYRDIFATYWLRLHPEDIATVSRALWHKNIEMTARRYAWAFDASHAMTRIEEHFDKLREP